MANWVGLQESQLLKCIDQSSDVMIHQLEQDHKKGRSRKCFNASHFYSVIHTFIRCHRCHSQKVKCSGEKPCSRCRRAGYAAQCRYANRDRKIRVDERYIAYSWKYDRFVWNGSKFWPILLKLPWATHSRQPRASRWTDPTDSWTTWALPRADIRCCGKPSRRCQLYNPRSCRWRNPMVSIPG